LQTGYEANSSVKEEAIMYLHTAQVLTNPCRIKLELAEKKAKPSYKVIVIGCHRWNFAQDV